MTSSVAEIDSLAEQMYASPDPTARQQAEQQLKPFISEGADTSVIFALLQETTNQYTLLFLAQGLVTWFREARRWMSAEQSREFVVDHCGGCVKRVMMGGAPRHVMTSMMASYARLTKLAFMREPYLKSAVTFALDLMSESDDRLHMLSLLLLDTMLNEFGRFDAARSNTYMNFATHRCCSNNFRDECSLDIFKVAVAELGRVNASSPYCRETVELVKSCLTYDFMAIIVDETEDALSAQFPSSWRDTLFNDTVQRVLWGQHAALPYPLCATMLTGLTSLCGIRRTFFDSAEERVEYLNRVLSLLVEAAGLNDGRLEVPHYVMLFADACFRFIAPFGYRELHQSHAFGSWIETLRAISVKVIAIPFGQEGSFTTATSLLRFWARLVTSRRVFCSSDDLPKDLEVLAPQLCLLFFQSRVCALAGDAGNTGVSGAEGGVGWIPTDGDDDYISAIEAMHDQSDSFSNMAQLDPTATLSLLVDYLQQSLGPDILRNAAATTWLFNIAGFLVRWVLTNVEQESVDACSRFFLYCVDCANHRRLAMTSQPQTMNIDPLFSIYVERAFLFFVFTLQTALIGFHLPEALTAVVTNVFQSQAQLFQFMLTNTGHNVVRQLSSSRDEEAASLIRTSVTVISEACGDMPASMLSEVHLDLPPVAELPLSQFVCSYKLRTNLHVVLWKLKNTGIYTQEVLLQFLQPISHCMRQSVEGGGGGVSASFTAGWLRDLRGVARAVHTHAEALLDFIQWFGEQIGVFRAVLCGPGGESPMIIISFLRFINDIVTVDRYGNASIPSGPHSTCGLVLFKQLTELIQLVVERCITEEHIRSVTSGGSVDGAYEYMLKPLALSMECLRRCVAGKCVPFGAMWFYGDDTYDRTLLGLLRMLCIFPHHLFQEYPKVSFAVVDLLRTVTDEMAFEPLVQLEASELQKILGFVISICEEVGTQTQTLLQGLSFLGFIANRVQDVKALAISPSLRPANAARSVAGTPPPLLQLPEYLSMTPSDGRGGSALGGGCCGQDVSLPSVRRINESLARLLEPFPDLWPRLITVAMNVIVCQDRGLSVCCSVVYPIFEAHPPFWSDFVERFVASYPARKQTAVREALSALSNAADSQERFFSEVYTFRQKLRNL